MAKPRRDSPVKRKARVSLPIVAPPPGSPFFGISGTNAPARNEKILNLTERVAEARAEKQRLLQGGLLTPAQQKAERQTAGSLAKPRPRIPLAKKPEPKTAPIRIGAPPAAPTAAPPRTPAAQTLPIPPGRRGAPPLGFIKGQGPKSPEPGWASHALGAAHDLGQSLDKAAARASLQLAEKARGIGTGAAPNISIPTIDLVGTAAAATGRKAITKDELKALEAQGVDLKPRLRKKFTANALKNGWNPAELDGLSGSALIDKAYTHPPPLPLRILANTAGGIAELGTLPAGIEGAVRETAAGRGGAVAKALGEGLISELPIVGKHRSVDTAVADPFGFFTQFAGVGKTAGAAAGAARGLRAGEAAERVVGGVSRGPLSRNAWNATGQLASDALARRVPRIEGRVRAKQIDEIVRSQINKHAAPWTETQRPYKIALDKVGEKRAADLSGYQMAGGKPEQLAAFYRAQGNKGQAKFFDRVAARTKTLSDDDRAFLDAHVPIAAKTTQGNIDIEKFGPTAAEFRRYSPLIRSSARLGNPDAQRILALRDEYLKGFNVMPEQDAAALRGAIDQGVQDFAKQHLASGGIEPTYVEYSKPLPLTPSPFKTGPGGPTGFKKPRGKQKAETGATFESGDYLIDPKAPLLASIRMQRAHLADVLHGEVAEAVGRHVTAGDEIRDGHVFVSETNLRGLRRTVTDLEDNPVSAPDYDELVGRQQGIFDRLKGAAVPSSQRVPRGEKGYEIPIAAWKRILDHTRPKDRAAYDRFMRQYQRVLVSYRPSTFVNNAVGSPILASTFGAGPKSYFKAFQSGRNRDPELAASYLSGGGVAGGLAPNPRSKIGKGFDWARFQSQKAEDFSRRATYFHAVLPGADKRAKELGYSETNAYLRDVAKGTVDEDRLNKGLDLAADALGDSLKPNGRFGRAASRGILFHNWVGHMAKTILYTLPVKHPRRLAILNELSDYGDQYRQEHGVWPDWYAAYLPLFQEVKRIGRTGRPQVFTKAYSTQGFNPFATLNNFAAPVSTNESAANILLGLANPIISTAGKTIFERPYDSKSVPRFIAGQVARQIPGVSVVAPSSGKSPDSIPIISEKNKVYSSGRKRHGKTIPLPYDFRPGARPEPGILGALERYLFGGVYDVPAQGPIHNIEQKKHIGAVAKAARR